MLRIAVCGVVLATSLVGCGHDPQEGMQKPVEVVKWDALDKLETEGLMGIEMSLEMGGDWSEARETLKSPEFEELANEFTQAPLPAGASDRAAGKDEAVKQLNALIEGASGSASDEDLKAALDALMAALKTLTGGS